jgi:hypothetical protein
MNAQHESRLFQYVSSHETTTHIPTKSGARNSQKYKKAKLSLYSAMKRSGSVTPRGPNLYTRRTRVVSWGDWVGPEARWTR